MDELLPRTLYTLERLQEEAEEAESGKQAGKSMNGKNMNTVG